MGSDRTIVGAITKSTNEPVLGCGCRYYGCSQVGLRRMLVLVDQLGNECAAASDPYRPCKMAVQLRRAPNETLCPIARAANRIYPADIARIV